MNLNRSMLAIATLLIAAGLSSGCATTMKLQYDAPEAGEPSKGEISVVFSDLRPANRGGDEPMRVGSVRNTFGMPFPLKAASGRQPAQVAKGLVIDCLEASGYRVVEPAAGVPQLHTGLQAFWTDGYQHSRVVVDMSLELRRDESAVPAWSHQLVSNTGVTWTAGYGQFDKGFTRTLDLAKGMLISELDGPEFAEGYASIR
jgi:hypothetical protein